MASNNNNNVYDTFQSNHLVKTKQKNTLTMKNVSHKKKCNVGTVQVHVDPPPIPLTKSKNDEKLDKYYV